MCAYCCGFEPVPVLAVAMLMMRGYTVAVLDKYQPRCDRRIVSAFDQSLLVGLSAVPKIYLADTGIVTSSAGHLKEFG